MFTPLEVVSATTRFNASMIDRSHSGAFSEHAQADDRFHEYLANICQGVGPGIPGGADVRDRNRAIRRVRRVLAEPTVQEQHATALVHSDSGNAVALDGKAEYPDYFSVLVASSI